MRFVFGGGGTGGHVVPALALADELRNGGHQAIFIGNSDSIEERLSTAEGYQFYTIRVQKLYREMKLSNLAFPFLLLGSIVRTVSILLRVKPDAVICTGGFVSGPVVIAAAILHIPLFCHESNSYPGLVTRAMSPFITRIFISFDATRKYLAKASLSKYGIPIRAKHGSEFNVTDIGLEPAKPIILVSGGSQGSLAINQAVDGALEALLAKGYQIIWQTGKNTYAQFASKHKDTNGLYIFDFTKHLTSMLGLSVIAITRAGAMTIAELEEFKTPAILVPLPTAADNHQYHNAVEQQNKGVALLLNQSALTPQSLIEAIETVESQLDTYNDNLNKLPHNNASKLIVEEILAALLQPASRISSNKGA